MTITQGGGGCPDEANVPFGAPSAVDDGELVVRCVRQAGELVWNLQGFAELDIGAIRREDLEGKGTKSVSVLREPPTARSDIAKRAADHNLQPEWINDPVVARAHVIELRTLVDRYKAPWRLVCVNADPTGGDDPLGPCPTHASIVRSRPQPGKEQRMDWLEARSKVAAAFKAIAHISGATVIQI
jgi:hypothetical protein